MIVVLRDLFDPLAVVNLFDEIIRFASNAFMHLGLLFASFLATVLSWLAHFIIWLPFIVHVLNKLDLETHLCVFYVMYRVYISLLGAKRLRLVYVEIIDAPLFALFVASPVLNRIYLKKNFNKL